MPRYTDPGQRLECQIAVRVAIVWNHPSRLLDCSFRFEQYVSGFSALGHEPVIVCHEGCEEGFPEPARTYPEGAFEDPRTWREVDAEVAVIVTWHRMSGALAAIRQAGLRVVAISDSDGQIGVRVHTRATFDRLWMYHRGPLARACCLKFWLEKYLAGGAAEDREHLASTRSSDSLVLGSSEGRRHFRRFLRHHGEDRLFARVTVIPFNVGASFLSCPLPRHKDDRIAAIGRWGDPQKDAGLLAATLERFLAQRPGTEVVVLGAGGGPWFDPLAARHPNLEYRGVVGQAEVARTLARCRSIVFSSRWEGSPHAANEALATGATLVGTPIPSLISWSEGGRFGRVAARSTPRALARTMLEEMTDWDRGRRDHRAIAAEWRRRLQPATICRQLLESLPPA